MGVLTFAGRCYRCGAQLSAGAEVDWVRNEEGKSRPVCPGGAHLLPAGPPKPSVPSPSSAASSRFGTPFVHGEAEWSEADGWTFRVEVVLPAGAEDLNAAARRAAILAHDEVRMRQQALQGGAE